MTFNILKFELTLLQQVSLRNIYWDNHAAVCAMWLKKHLIRNSGDYLLLVFSKCRIPCRLGVAWLNDQLPVPVRTDL